MKDRLLLLVVIALLVGLGFVATQIVFTYDAALSRFATAPTAFPKRTAQPPDDLTAMLARLPGDDNVVAAEKLPNDSVLAVTNVPSTGSKPNFLIWFIPAGNAEPILLKEHWYSNPKVEFDWSHDYSRVVVSLVGLTEFFPQSTHDYIDTENGRWLAGIVEPSFQTVTIETAEGPLRFESEYTSACKDGKNTATALVINGTKIPFEKPIRVTCELMCEGECAYEPPGFGPTTFSNDFRTDPPDVVRFSMPWGTPVTLDLASPTSSIRSADFAKEYPFQEESRQ